MPRPLYAPNTFRVTWKFYHRRSDQNWSESYYVKGANLDEAILNAKTLQTGRMGWLGDDFGLRVQRVQDMSKPRSGDFIVYQGDANVGSLGDGDSMNPFNALFIRLKTAD